MLRSLCPGLTLCLLFALAPAPAAGTLFVDAGLTTGANDGSTWANAFQGSDGLQAALAAASSGDLVFAATGTYFATDTGSRSVSFNLINGVEVYGGFLGGEAAPEDRPPVGSAPSVLDGDLNGDDGSGLFGDNTLHVVRTTGTTASAVLDGFTVTSGAATNGGGNNDRGAGILCLGNVSPTIRNCRFLANRSSFGGAHGYVNNGGAPSFTDCRFEDGVGGSFGGAFDVASAGAVLWERCFFSGNTAQRGGALEIFASTGVIVDNCVFTGNAATGSGGGGGVWMGTGGNPVVRNCTFVGNTSSVNNVGGLRTQSAGQSSVANCVFWANVGPGGTMAQTAQINLASNLTYSLVMGGFAGTGNVSTDPLFADQPGGDFTPTAGSPVIDAADNSAVPAGTTLDFAGDARFVDDASVADTGVGPAPVVDMGAFEFAPGGDLFVNLGNGLAGTSGEPVLVLSGPLTGGSTLDVSLTNTLPASTAFFVVGAVELNAPLKGGILVPNPDVVVGLPTGAGSLIFGATWPAGLPSGFQTFYQAWIQDAGGPSGFAASNGVGATTP